MKNRFAMDIAKLKFYLNENEGWQKTLQLQESEIPAMKKMLEDAAVGNEERGKVHFNKELNVQQTEMRQLTEDLEKQQQRLAKDCETNILFDIDAFLIQDILRERIKAIEKLYIDLRCNFMNYLATWA
jgi:hypothetical protein